MNLYGAFRRYTDLNNKRREELASAIGKEVVPHVDDTTAFHAFFVIDEEDTLTSVTVFQDRTAAEMASKRPSTDPELIPEVSVREIATTSNPK